MPTPAAPLPEKGDNSETLADTDAKEACAKESGTKEKRGAEDNAEPDEDRSTKKVTVTVKDIEMEDSLPEHKDQAPDGPPGPEISTGAAAAESVSYQASEGKRIRVAAKIEEAVGCAMDSGDVGMIMAVQEAIESEEGEWAASDEIWGGKQWLDPRLVKEGRLDEMMRPKHFDVYEVVDEWEATGQIVHAKRVDRQTGSVVRSRIVARWSAAKSLEHLFAGTPDATVLRAILSNLATDKDKVLLVADVTSAYHEAPVVIDQYVRSPVDLREKGKLWKLKRAMPGLRMASRSWQDHYASAVE